MFSSLLPKIVTFSTLSFVFASFLIPTVSLEAKSTKSVVKKTTTSYIKSTKTPKNLAKNNNTTQNKSNAVNSNTNSPINLVKKSKNNICHNSSSQSYTRTKVFTSFSSLEDCLNSGGNLPLK